MKTTKQTRPEFDGNVLVLPRWDFSLRDARVPHRDYTLSSFDNGKQRFHVKRNHGSFRGLFWVHASGNGFAGPNSRASLTCSTRNERLAAAWVEAVKAGNVRISDRD